MSDPVKLISDDNQACTQTSNSDQTALRRREAPCGAMWSSPWGYRENLIVVAGLIAVGLALQLTVGPFDIYLLYWPGNLIVAGSLLLLSIAGLFFKKFRLIRWLSSVQLAVALTAGLLIFSLIMGLVPQLAHLPDPAADQHPLVRLGWARMTSSWPFILIYLLTMLSLGLVTAKRLGAFRRNITFLLNHAGLWLMLIAAGLGAADRQRHVMHVREGEVEWRVYSDQQEVLELPLAIRLNDFDLEEYAPKLAVIDRSSGHPLPEGRPALMQIDPAQPRGLLLDWDIVLMEYIHRAVPAENGYREVPMPASVPAARIMAKNIKTAEMVQGWVTSGNNMLPIAALTLDDHQVLVMTQAEPKRFMSDIKVFTEDGLEKAALLEVNHPLRAGHWMIYQYSYDNQAGRMSTYSGFELVYDPWLNVLYLGLVMVTLGSLGLIWRGRSRPALKNRPPAAEEGRDKQ